MNFVHYLKILVHISHIKQGLLPYHSLNNILKVIKKLYL
ncbi:hypothetical protein K661_02609 [Piscirickettsia salmonis LF-89 = ATCC VR-1361]|nr:hypothetical protein K661_02609 [Piscirickettsia salmonis LF-89 = ATCC VR-1361]